MCRHGDHRAETAPDDDPDGDGFPSSADCKPLDPDSHPGASETCDGIDNDCDGATDVALDLCDDGVDCTVDLCEEDSDQVLHTPDDVPLVAENNALAQLSTELYEILKMRS